MTPHDQRHVDRAARGQALILRALTLDLVGLGRPDWSLAQLAEYCTNAGLPADSNDTQVWAAMLRTRSQITAVSRTGPVRYALAGRAS